MRSQSLSNKTILKHPFRPQNLITIQFLQLKTILRLDKLEKSNKENFSTKRPEEQHIFLSKISQKTDKITKSINTICTRIMSKYILFE